MGKVNDLPIDDAVGLADVAQAQKLFKEYGSDVSRSYCLRGFDREVAMLPGDYAPPKGCLLLIKDGGVAFGMVAMRPSGDGTAEMKRLFVRPSYLGHGHGRRLAEAVVERARMAGYRSLRLDTLGHMKAAQQLYLRMGFKLIDPYHDDAAPGMKFMELIL